MLSLQNRVREILTADPWFQSPVEVFVEDRAGLAAATTDLTAPAVFIKTTSGESVPTAGFVPPTGTCLLTETLTVKFVQTLATDETSRVVLEGVETAIHLLHEAPLWPGETAPQNVRIRVAGHTATEVRVSVPIQIASVNN